MNGWVNCAPPYSRVLIVIFNYPADPIQQLADNSYVPFPYRGHSSNTLLNSIPTQGPSTQSTRSFFPPDTPHPKCLTQTNTSDRHSATLRTARPPIVGSPWSHHPHPCSTSPSILDSPELIPLHGNINHPLLNTWPKRAFMSIRRPLAPLFPSTTTTTSVLPIGLPHCLCLHPAHPHPYPHTFPPTHSSPPSLPPRPPLGWIFVSSVKHF